jgi:hypothetical protein
MTNNPPITKDNWEEHYPIPVEDSKKCEKCRRTSTVVNLNDKCPFCSPLNQAPEENDPIGVDCQCDLGSEKHYHPDCEYVVAPESKEWEEEFDKLWKRYLISKTDEIQFNEIKHFIATQISKARSEAQREILEEITRMKKEVCGCDTDPDPMSPGYHTKNCDLEPYGYNQAIDEIISKYKKNETL